jgi:hypothetical protein
MVICSNCQAENRSGARFCKNCAAALPKSSAVTKALKETMQTIPLNLDPQKQGPQQGSRTGTRPLVSEKAFSRRPLGAIFGDRFINERSTFSDENQHSYQVRQLDLGDVGQQIRSCSNPACGAIFPPRGEESEKFCTDCGTALDGNQTEFVLIENHASPPDSVVGVIAKGLSHNNLRAPVLIFEETLAEQMRYCLIIPQVQPIEAIPSNEQVLGWGRGLARGLDYLHDNGVTFEGKVDSSLLGLVNGDRPVWVEFTTCKHHPEGYVTDRRSDVQALAMFCFLLTGRLKYEPDPNLLPAHASS